MISPKLQDALNAQINAEFWSAYFYLSIAMHFDNAGQTGVSNWFKIQYKEELAHAEILMNYLNMRGGRVELSAVAAVPTKWDTVLAAFQDTLKHEQQVTARINELYRLATEEHDYATTGKLDWFIAEQVEEEETTHVLIDRLKMVGDNGMGLYMIDQELGGRTYSTPAPLAGKE